MSVHRYIAILPTLYVRFSVLFSPSIVTNVPILNAGVLQYSLGTVKLTMFPTIRIS